MMACIAEQVSDNIELEGLTALLDEGDRCVGLTALMRKDHPVKNELAFDMPDGSKLLIKIAS